MKHNGAALVVRLLPHKGEGATEFAACADSNSTKTLQFHNANKKASEAANALGVTPPSGPNSRQQADYDRMSKMSGAKFDAQFVKHMIADHKKDIKEYEKKAKKDDAVGAYAEETLPPLHKHLGTAQSLSSAAKMSSR